MTHPAIHPFTLGSFQTNCYLVVGPAPGHAWLADCGFRPAPILQHLAELHLTLDAIVLTHAHCDHIAGLADARAAHPAAPVLLHDAERDWLADPALNLSAMLGQMLPGPEGQPIITAPPDRLIAHAEVLTLAGADWRVIHTPGHSPGGCAFYHEPSATLIAGDALFAGSVGRTDFPGSDHDTLITSIRERLYTLPADTRVLPGHGPSTTIGRERLTNPYARA